MRIFKILVFLTVFSFHSFGQTSIKLSIKNGEQYSIDKIDLLDLSQKEILESPYKNIVDFTFKKEGINCYNIRYHNKEKKYLQQVWLDTGNIEIQLHIDSSKLIIDTVLNSPLYYDYLNFKEQFALLYQKKDSITINKMLLDLFEKNIETPYSFIFSEIYLRLNQNSVEDLRKLKALTDKQGEKFKWFLFYKIVTERLNNIFKVNSLNLEKFSFLDIEGKVVKLISSPDKLYILDFWVLACAPCKKDHKIIQNQTTFLETKNAEVISISIDKDLKKWKSYLSSFKYSWKNYLEIDKQRLTEALKIEAFPYYVIIDSNGNIKSTHNSFGEVLNWLKKE